MCDFLQWTLYDSIYSRHRYRAAVYLQKFVWNGFQNSKHFISQHCTNFTAPPLFHWFLRHCTDYNTAPLIHCIALHFRHTTPLHCIPTTLLHFTALHSLYYTILHCAHYTHYSLVPVVCGIRIQPTFALLHVLRCDSPRNINCPIPPAYCMHGLIACSEGYEFGQLGTMLSWFR